jgi:hypothetical protein
MLISLQINKKLNSFSIMGVLLGSLFLGIIPIHVVEANGSCGSTYSFTVTVTHIYNANNDMDGWFDDDGEFYLSVAAYEGSVDPSNYIFTSTSDTYTVDEDSHRYPNEDVSSGCNLDSGDHIYIRGGEADTLSSDDLSNTYHDVEIYSSSQDDDYTVTWYISGDQTYISLHLDVIYEYKVCHPIC